MTAAYERKYNTTVLPRFPGIASWFGRDGKPLSVKWYLRHKEDDSYVRVAHDVIGDKEVSTIWLGLNHEYSGQRAPLIFETMIFGPNRGEGEEGCWRYSTEAEALEGHKRIVRWLVAKGSSDLLQPRTPPAIFEDYMLDASSN